MTKKEVNLISYMIVGCAIEVHKNLGPGLLESVYHQCFERELTLRNIKYKSQVKVHVVYKGVDVGGYLVLDMLVEDTVVVELKAVDELNRVHKAQLLSYLKLANKPKGLLINFNCENVTKNLIPLVTETFNQLQEE